MSELAERPGILSSSPQADRVGVEQVAALFSAVSLSVLGATAAADILVFALVRLEAVAWPWGIAWAAYIALCAVAHLLLYRVYRRARREDVQWRGWALAFTIICALEGIGWGWMPVMVAMGGAFDVEMLTLVVTLGLACGAIPAFSPFLPAFAAFFFPATIPYGLWSAMAPGTLHQATTTLMLLFVPAIFGLGATASRSFRQLVRLRVETATLAEDLRRQKEYAEAANLAKSTFLAAASHDLRQPVHALGLFVGALRGVAMPQEGQRLLEQIEASTAAMDGLFTALLDISRLDAGVVEVHLRAFPITPVLDRICAEHGAEAASKGIDLILCPSSAWVVSDPLLVERVVRNLVSNAVRYTDGGRVLVGCRRQGHVLSIEVWDTGRGIPEEQQDKVFQEYYQLGNAERDRTRGLGLGLAIVRRLTDLLNARLTLTSRPGQGSCFAIALPLAEEADRNNPVDEGPLLGALAQGLVVVVDDERPIREGMATLLRGWGYEVVTAASGDQAMTLLAVLPTLPALIISDYRLRDGEQGIDVIDRLRAEYNNTIPAMLITGDTAPHRLVEAQASGLLLLHKPVSNSRLRAAIVNLLSQAGSAI